MKVNQKIEKYLSEVYGNTFTPQHYEALNSRIEKARSLISKQRKMHWDERDVVLITYADQFHSDTSKPLPTFNQFHRQWLATIFSHLHLLPFYPWSSDDGFSVIDYHQVAPETGEWEDIRELSQSSQLMFDFVCNHISAKSEWFNHYLQQTPGFENFFIAVDPSTDLSSVTRHAPYRCLHHLPCKTILFIIYGLLLAMTRLISIIVARKYCWQWSMCC